MAQYLDENRYDIGLDLDQSGINADQIELLTGFQDVSDVKQDSPDQVTANQNNYPLATGNIRVVRLSTDASRTFTGFAGARPEHITLVNVGSQDVVIANASVLSTEENRVLTHTGGNITLNPLESVEIFYDYTDSRWRTKGFS